jgi:hypothetical protein
MAGYRPDEGAALREVEGLLRGTSRGRLFGVLVARQGVARRLVPEREEAEILEEIWRLQAPGSLIYDVDDPSGAGIEVELHDILAKLHDFHAGGDRPRPDGGGIFWASLAPG